MKTTQVVAAVGVAFVVGAVAGYFIGQGTTPTNPCLTPGNHTLSVARDGTPECPDVVIIWKQSRLTWISPSDTTLSVRLRATSIGQPACQGNTCTFGPVMTSVSTQPYDYDTTVSGSPAPGQGNARIIIKK